METGVAFAALDPDHDERFLPLRRMLGVTSFGINQLILRPGQRGRIHRHRDQEEVYLVVSGSAVVQFEDGSVELGEWDAVRIPPDVARSFQAGPDGAELLAFGAGEQGDAEMIQEFQPG
jgi:mannose-6-phosphate isomerase-like protein (cupin superfamily)